MGALVPDEKGIQAECWVRQIAGYGLTLDLVTMFGYNTRMTERYYGSGLDVCDDYL